VQRVGNYRLSMIEPTGEGYLELNPPSGYMSVSVPQNPFDTSVPVSVFTHTHSYRAAWRGLVD